MAHVYQARVLTTDTPAKRVWWLWSKTSLMRGAAGESLAAIRKRWAAEHGEITEVTAHRGTMRLSEAAMTVGATRRLPPRRD